MSRSEVMAEVMTGIIQEAQAEAQEDEAVDSQEPAAMRVSKEIRVKCYQAAEVALENVVQQTGWKRRKVARAYRKGKPQIVAMINAEAAIQGWDIDPENLREILQVILEFIMALLAMFAI